MHERFFVGLAEGHGTEADFRDTSAGVTEVSVFHLLLFAPGAASVKRYRSLLQVDPFDHPERLPEKKFRDARQLRLRIGHEEAMNG